jgi:hypothetical protein
MGTKKFRSELILSGAPMSKDINAGPEARNFCRRRDKIDDFGMHGKNKSASPARDKNEQLFFDTHLSMRVFPAKKDMIYSSRVCTCPCKPMRSRGIRCKARTRDADSRKYRGAETGEQPPRDLFMDRKFANCDVHDACKAQ